MNAPSLSAADTSSDVSLEAAALRKITWRIMPFLFLVYVLSYLDRVNIGYAKLQFTGDLGLSNAAYGLGAGIFFFGYFVFEVPSNLLLKKFGARATIAYIGILAGFGIFWSMSTTFLQGTAAVAGIAVINSIANLAGYVSPYVLGIVKDATHSVTFGLVLIAGALIVGGLVTLTMPRVKVQHAVAVTPSNA